MTGTVWALLGQIVVLLLMGALVIALERIRQRVFEWYNHRRLHPLARSVMANKKVNTLLVELRVNTEADRAYVFLFHNGQNFSNDNPVWRMSCTQETCRKGITYENEHLQSLLASTVWDAISPLFGDEAGPGIHTYKHDKHTVYVYNTHDLADGYLKRSLAARGISKKVTSAILDANKRVVGFLALNYCCDESHNMKEIADKMSETAANIHYALSRE